MLYLHSKVHELVWSVVQPQEPVSFLGNKLKMEGLIGHHLHHLWCIDSKGTEIVVDVGTAEKTDGVCGVAPGVAENLPFHIFIQITLGLGGHHGCS